MAFGGVALTRGGLAGVTLSAGLTREIKEKEINQREYIHIPFSL